MEAIESANPAVPAQSEDHTEIEVEIKDILDAFGTSIMDGASEYDPKEFAVDGDTKSKIKYEVKNQEASFLFLLVTPDSDAAREYYRRLAAVLESDQGVSGEGEFEWDGRSRLQSQRLILEGEYTVRVVAQCAVCGTIAADTKTFKVRKAYGQAYAYSSTTPREQRIYETPASHTRSELESLPDGTGFDTAGDIKVSPGEALNMMVEKSAVWFLYGHGNAGVLWFGEDDLILASTELASTVSSRYTVATVSEVPEQALDDVFLAVLYACETNRTPAQGPSLPSVMREKGVDIVVSFPESSYQSSNIPWARDFVAALKNGEGVNDAAETAKLGRPSEEQTRLDFRVDAGFGAGSNDKLLPARYGAKSS